MKRLISIITAATISLLLTVSLAAADDAGFGLAAGETLPDISADSVNKERFEMQDALSNGPVVVVFIRGAWYPYCTAQLKELEARITPILKRYKASMVAVTIDRASKVKQMLETTPVSFPIISDPDAKIISEYKLSEVMPDERIEHFMTVYDIDIESYSGKRHHIVAKPALYVANSKGTILYAYANSDYKERADMKAVKRALMKAGSMRKRK